MRKSKGWMNEMMNTRANQIIKPEKSKIEQRKESKTTKTSE